MTNFYPIQQLLISLLVLGGAFSSCQRASYSFQPPAPVEAAKALMFVSTTAVASPAPAVAEVEAACERHNRRLPARKPIAGPAERGIAVVAAARLLHPAPHHAESRRLALPPRRAPAPESTLAAPPNKWVAVTLAVLLGFFGAHLFYLGNSKRGLGYLAITLLCVGLIAVLLASLPVSSLNSGFAILTVICLAVIGIAGVYVHALFDALRIIIEGTDAVN